MKFAKILICTILMVAILSVPCFATNEGMYGHYISPGIYQFKDSLSGYAVGTSPYEFSITFRLLNSNTVYTGIYTYSYSADRLGDLYFNPVAGDGIRVYRNGWDAQSYRTFEVLEGFYIYDSAIYQWWVYNVYSYDSFSEPYLLNDILSMFGFVGTWITEASSDLALMFWDPTEGALTFVGTLTIAALAVSVCFLIIGLIQRFLRFKS